MKIQRSIYRTAVILAAIPFLLFSFLVIHLYNERLDTVITESLYAVANVQISEMHDFCDRQRQTLAIIGEMSATRAALRGELSSEARQYLDNQLAARVLITDYLTSLSVISADYRVIGCSQAHTPIADSRLGILLDVSDEPFFISNMVNSRGDSTVQTLVAVFRVEVGGETLGYVLAEIDADFYQRLRAQAEFWSNSTFYLLDGNGNIISAGTAEEGRDSFVTTAEERKDYYEKYGAIDFETDPQGHFRYTVNGSEYITYYSTVEYTQWTVMLSVNMDHFHPQQAAYHMLAVFIILLCGLLALGIGIISSRHIVAPVQRISKTLGSIRSTQDYSLRVDISSKDELGALGGEINDLLDFIETENLYKVQQQRLLQHKAERDALTQTLNKEHIVQYLQESLHRHRADGSALAVLFIDVDDFKSFNTQYGHSTGDQVLQFLSGIVARETGGTVGRVGGDEFLAVVESLDSVQSLDVCLNRVKLAADNQFIRRGKGRQLPICCCIGAVVVDFSKHVDGGLTAERLVQMADTAMYQVKHHGKHGHAIVEYNDTSDPV